MEDLKKKIIDLVDGSRDPWRKVAFYSNQVVSDILTKLYDRWEKSGRKGTPLDYATKDELDILYKYAKASVEASEGEVLRSIMEERDDTDVQKQVEKKSLFKRVFSRRR